MSKNCADGKKIPNKCVVAGLLPNMRQLASKKRQCCHRAALDHDGQPYNSSLCPIPHHLGHGHRHGPNTTPIRQDDRPTTSIAAISRCEPATIEHLPQTPIYSQGARSGTSSAPSFGARLDSMQGLPVGSRLWLHDCFEDGLGPNSAGQCQGRPAWWQRLCPPPTSPSEQESDAEASGAETELRDPVD